MAPPGEARELAPGETVRREPGPALDAPDASYTTGRWIPKRTVDWVRDADRIMLEHGVVQGRALVAKRYQARWRAQRLIKLMVELRLHERWELSEHTEQHPTGWVWLVEYRGGGQHGR